MEGGEKLIQRSLITYDANETWSHGILNLEIYLRTRYKLIIFYIELGQPCNTTFFCPLSLKFWRWGKRVINQNGRNYSLILSKPPAVLCSLLLFAVILFSIKLCFCSDIYHAINMWKPIFKPLSLSFHITYAISHSFHLLEKIDNVRSGGRWYFLFESNKFYRTKVTWKNNSHFLIFCLLQPQFHPQIFYYLE